MDVVGGPRDGRYAVLKRLGTKDGGARYLVLSTSGRVSTLGYKQIPWESSIAGSIDLPKPFNPRDRRFIQETLRRLRKVSSKPDSKQKTRRARVNHPVASCPDAPQHLAAHRRARRTRRRIEQYQAMRRASGHGLVEEFRTIHELLAELDYVDGWSLTTRGERLRRIYNESDLMLAEAIERGVFYDLPVPELAALLSVFVYEPRSDQASVPEWETREMFSRWSQIEDIWRDVTARESRLRLSTSRRPDPGFGMLAYQWTQGVEFDDLPTRGMAPGDFVRVSRQLADLLRQIRDSVGEMSEDVAQVLAIVDRGVVAAQGIG